MNILTPYVSLVLALSSERAVLPVIFSYTHGCFRGEIWYNVYMKKKYWQFFVCILFSVGFFAALEVFAAPYLPYIDYDFVLFWSVPTRAYPEVPLDFRFVAYEKDNQTLTWQFINAPLGMSVDANGKVSWTPTTAQTGTYNVTVRVTREAGDYIERTFAITVGTSDFIFVSTTGSDSGSGTIDSPFLTIEHAMRAIQDGNGKTILVRGGTYHEVYKWETGGVISPWRGKNFSASDPVEVRSYPGEWAILDADLSGHGFWAYSTNYVLFDNIEVQNASAAERGGIMVNQSSHVIVRDTVVHDSHWSYASNCTGYLVGSSSDVVLDHTEGYNNIDSNNSESWNSSNYLLYPESPSSGIFYILNSTSHNSVAGFKIKHAGPARLILQNNVSYDEDIGYAPGSDYSSVSYCVAYNTRIGIFAGVSDPSDYNIENILIDHNTIVNASEAGIFFQGGYFTGSPSVITNNIIYNDLGAAGTVEGDRRLMGFWYYDDNANAYSLSSDHNLFYSPSQDNIIRYGHTNFNFSFASWKTKGYDTNSIFANPLFVNVSSYNFAPQTGSSACFSASDGSDIGALPCNGGTPDSVAPASPGGLSLL